jgi:hypothetical protein
MLVLVVLVGKQGGSFGTQVAAGEPAADALVLAGAGSTVHRADCALIAHRDDLHPLTGSETGLGTCRVCRPDLD